MAATEGQTLRPEEFTVEELEVMDKAAVITYCKSLSSYVDSQENKKQEEEKIRQQYAEAMRREALLLKTLTEKERELAELMSQIEELKQYQLPSNAQLRSSLLDPAVNVVFNRMKKELESTKQRLEDSQNELSAWKFTQDSQTGKQLMARCRTLLKENDELGKQLSQGRIAKLEGEIALEKKLVEEMKAAQAETDDFVLELDEEMEGMQATIYLLQQQLKEAKEKITYLEHQHSRSIANSMEVADAYHNRMTSHDIHEPITPTEGTGPATTPISYRDEGSRESQYRDQPLTTLSERAFDSEMTARIESDLRLEKTAHLERTCNIESYVNGDVTERETQECMDTDATDGSHEDKPSKDRAARRTNGHTIAEGLTASE